MERQRQNRRNSIRKARFSKKLAVSHRRPGSCVNPSRRFPALAVGKANLKLSTSCVYLRRFAFTSANGTEVRGETKAPRVSATERRGSARPRDTETAGKETFRVESHNHVTINHGGRERTPIRKLSLPLRRNSRRRRMLSHHTDFQMIVRGWLLRSQ